MDSTQLRLHGRWMDLATQAAEAPTSDPKKKRLGNPGWDLWDLWGCLVGTNLLVKECQGP